MRPKIVFIWFKGGVGFHLQNGDYFPTAQAIDNDIYFITYDLMRNSTNTRKFRISLNNRNHYRFSEH